MRFVIEITRNLYELALTIESYSTSQFVLKEDCGHILENTNRKDAKRI
jgi:hypothetical protein